MTTITTTTAVSRPSGPAVRRPSTLSAWATLTRRRIALSARTPREVLAPLATPILFALVIAPALAKTIPTAGPGGLDYRSAHKVVGRAVRELVEAGEPPSALTPERLSAAAEAVIGTPVDLGEATLRAALDPAACAAARLQTGSSSEAAMDAMLEGLAATLAADQAWSTTAGEREAAAEAALLSRARDLA